MEIIMSSLIDKSYSEVMEEIDGYGGYLNEIDNRIWDKVKDIHTIEKYKTYLKVFSDGLHVSEAQEAIGKFIKVEKLKNQKQFWYKFKDCCYSPVAYEILPDAVLSDIDLEDLYLYSSEDNFGELIFCFRKINKRRFFYFLGLTTLMLFFYLLYPFFIIAAFSSLMNFQWGKLLEHIFIIVVLPVLYVGIFIFVTNIKESSIRQITSMKALFSELKKFIFPFNKLSLSKSCIYYYLCSDGIYTSADLDTGFLNNKYSYNELIEDADYQNELGIWKFLNEECKYKIFEFAEISVNKT